MLTHRKLQANARELHRDVERQITGHRMYTAESTRLNVEAAARRREVGEKMVDQLSARTSVGRRMRPSRSDAALSERQRKEKIRETARDCIRREQSNTERARLSRLAMACLWR